MCQLCSIFTAGSRLELLSSVSAVFQDRYVLTEARGCPFIERPHPSKSLVHLLLFFTALRLFYLYAFIRQILCHFLLQYRSLEYIFSNLFLELIRILIA